MSRPKLYEYQKKASQFLMDRKRSLLRLDTGLGKTAVCIDAAKRLGVHKVLVIAPAFLKENWLREIKLWDGLGLDWTIVSYTACSKLNRVQALTDNNSFDMVICDEAHYLKNWEAKRTQNIIKRVLGKKAARVVLSTATPYVRSAADLHPLFSVCEPGKWGAFGTFCEKYCKKKPNHFKRWKKFDYYGVNEENARELKARSKAFTISYKKADVLPDLPEKMTVDIDVRVSRAFDLDLIREENEEVIDVDTGRVSGGLYRVLSREMNKLGEAKVTDALEWIGNFSQSEPLVIFCKHISVGEALAGSLDRSYHWISGKTSTPLRDMYVRSFQERKVKTLVCTMASCGVGINLTAASSCLFVELPWSFTELKQCEDRLHRIGQKNCVQSFRMVAKDTLDEMVVGILNNKVEGEELSVGGLE